MWSADGAGTGVSALLTSIGSGSVSATDRVAVTSFSSSFALAPSTHYFIKITAASGNLGIALGPNSNTALNSVTRYGVGNLNNTTTSAIGMEVTVATAPTFPVLAGLLAGLGALAGFRRRRISDVS